MDIANKILSSGKIASRSLSREQECANRSAMGCALARHLESNKAKTRRLFSDPYAKVFLTPEFFLEYKSSNFSDSQNRDWLFRLSSVRERYVDDLLYESIREDIGQLVLLGSGYDSRALRIQELRTREIKVFEIDQVFIIEKKKQAILQNLHFIPSNIRFVEMDFHKDSFERLLHASFNPDAKTVFVAQALSYYLSTGAMRRIFDFIATRMTATTKLIFDYVNPQTMDMIGYSGWLTHMGQCPFSLEPNIAKEYLMSVGFRNVLDLSIQDIEMRYFQQVTLPSYSWHICACSN